MYKSAKGILKAAIPARLLYTIEPLIRYIYAITLRGNKVTCNVCGVSFHSFVQSNKHLICPNCGSIERNRRLWKILQEHYLNDGISILDFSPSRCIYRKLKKQNLNYIATDLSKDFISDYQYDITDLPIPSGSVDVIVCYHILEHVPDDVKAISELTRVLANNGTCLIQTPFKEGETYEDSSITSPEERLNHFGQEDHVRIYSVSGLKHRLEQAGLAVAAQNFRESPENLHGFSTAETILYCVKV